MLSNRDSALVWSSKPVKEEETADGKRVVTPLALPSSVRFRIQKAQARNAKIIEQKTAAQERKKAERQVRHQQLLQEQQQRKQERLKMSSDSNINRRFGEAVVNKREALGLTVEQLAAVFGWEVDFMARVETGDQGLYFDNALKVVHVLQLRIEHFLELQDVHVQRGKLAAAIADQEKAVEDEMMKLRKQMDELTSKKNLISRVKNGGASL